MIDVAKAVHRDIPAVPRVFHGDHAPQWMVTRRSTGVCRSESVIVHFALQLHISYVTHATLRTILHLFFLRSDTGSWTIEPPRFVTTALKSLQLIQTDSECE